MKSIFITIVLALFMFSCVGTQKLSNENFYNKTWKLQSANGFSQADIESFDQALIKFSQSDSVYSGNNGCNMFSGKFALSGNKIKFGESLSTKRFCRGIDEFRFIKLLDETNSISVKQGKLFFKNDKKIVAVFESE